MKQKTHGEKIQELDTKIHQLEARKEQIENRSKEKERKKRTRRLIQVGAIFEKYFEIEDVEEAEKMAIILNKRAKEIKAQQEKLEKIDIEKLKTKF